jgi:hypothetical protein
VVEILLVLQNQVESFISFLSDTGATSIGSGRRIPSKAGVMPYSLGQIALVYASSSQF